MSLKTVINNLGPKGRELLMFSSPCGAVRRSTYLASGNEFKNVMKEKTEDCLW